ncbi:MAG: hypothetical protein ACOZAM_16885 [Pseudomonadota bacterium]
MAAAPRWRAAMAAAAAVAVVGPSIVFRLDASEAAAAMAPRPGALQRAAVQAAEGAPTFNMKAVLVETAAHQVVAAMEMTVTVLLVGLAAVA